MSKWKLIRPAAGRNLVTNPSFETNTTGWAAIATGTIDYAPSPSGAIGNVYGSKIGLVGLASSGDGVYYAITLAASTTYYLQLILGSFAPYTVKVAIVRTDTSAEVASENIALSVLPSVGYRFSKLNFSFTTPATTGFRINITHVSGTIGMLFPYFMIDGVQVTEDNISTYIDGDQSECVWEGVPHNSTSRTRFSLPTNRSIGLLVDLQDDYGFYIREAKGVGMAGLDWGTIKRGAPYAGSVVTSVRTPARGISFKGTLIGTSHTNVNDTRNQIINDVSPYLVPFVNGAPQPVHLRYEGTQKTLELLCDYKDGLDKDFNEVETYTDEFALQFIAHDNPYWQEIADTTTVLDNQDTIDVYGVAAQSDGVWGTLGITSLSGASPEVRAVKWGPDGKLYFGGTFTQVNSVADTAYIARYNPVTAEIESLSTVSLGAAVNALFFGPENTLYVGGAFTNVTDANGDYVTMWKDTIYGGTGAWVSLVAANPLNGEVRCFALDGQTGNILIGGDFTTGSGATLNRITSYDGAFNALGTGLDNVVRAVAYLSDGRNTILVGGDFANAGGSAAAYIAAYTASDGWFNIGTLNAAVYAIASYEQGAVVVGAFTTFDTETARRVIQITSVTPTYTGWFTFPAAPYAASGYPNTAKAVAIDGNGIVHAIITDGVQQTMIWKFDGSVSYFEELYIEPVSSYDNLAIDINQYNEIAFGGDANGTTFRVAGITEMTLQQGASETYGVIEVYRSGGSFAYLFAIKNIALNHQIILPILILDNEKIIIDTKTLICTSSFNRLITQPLPNTNPLSLYAQQNKISLFCASDATISATLRWRPQYHSYDAAEDAS